MTFSIIVMGIIGAVLIFFINKSRMSGPGKVALSIVLIHQFFLHGVMQRFVNENLPNVVSFLDKIPGGMGTTLLVTVALYFVVLYYIRRR